jgi:DcuC family C4-dicarboxylate transporter
VQQIWPNGIAVSAIMVVCTGLVILATAPGLRSLARHASMVSVEFFSGMGYAFTNVISVIIAATCFLAGLDAVGAIKAVSSAIAANQGLSHVLSPLSTAILAVVSGSGTAPSLAFSQAVLPSIVEMGSTGVAVALGVAGAIGASIGRTTSPVSAVMHFTSSLTNVPVPDLVRFVWLPLAAALVSAMLYGLVFL